jgi:nucleoside-diphosphate-sugar epimerase
MQKSVLLTGASGAVGYEAFKCLLLRKEQYRIRVLSIDKKLERNLFKPNHDQIEVIWGDIRIISDVRKAVKGVDAILHVAGIIPPAADLQPEKARAVNVMGTKNLVDVCLEQPTPPKLIFTSSISVYGDRVHEPNISIGDPLNPSEGDEYAQTKIDAENFIKASGITWSIFRLCGILANRLQIQPLMFHMPLDTALEWCHPSDAGYALVEAIENDTINNRTFNLGGGERCRILARDFIRQVFPIWGLDSDLLPESAFALKNFHSGYYIDGDELNHILKFRRYSLQDYIQSLRDKVLPIERYLIKAIPKPIVRNWLLSMSEPLKAIRENNELLIKRFYGSRQAYFNLTNL